MMYVKCAVILGSVISVYNQGEKKKVAWLNTALVLLNVMLHIF